MAFCKHVRPKVCLSIKGLERNTCGQISWNVGFSTSVIWGKKDRSHSGIEVIVRRRDRGDTFVVVVVIRVSSCNSLVLVSGLVLDRNLRRDQVG